MILTLIREEIAMKRQEIIGTIVLIAAVVGFLVGSNWSSRATAGETKEVKKRVFELRTYHTNLGKLQELNARFSNHTNKLFAKHNITPIGYWTPAEGPDAENTLIYIVAHESREAAKKNWAAFGADPDWKKARDESEVNGKLVNKVESVYLNPTDYSEIK